MAVLESLVVGVLGVLLLINPDGILKLIFYVVGIFLMIKGVYKIINYFAVHGKYDFTIMIFCMGLLRWRLG